MTTLETLAEQINARADAELEARIAGALAPFRQLLSDWNIANEVPPSSAFSFSIDELARLIGDYAANARRDTHREEAVRFFLKRHAREERPNYEI